VVTIALPLLAVWAFLRLSTNPRVWPNPKTAAEAFGIVMELLAVPGVVLLQPGARHIEILEALVTRYKATGPLMTDAVLAAMALECGGRLASTDRDFSRFENLRWFNPLAE
jgi:toxin-antitoxin system PIN domain toxin